jgi:hypothetical protein
MERQAGPEARHLGRWQVRSRVTTRSRGTLGAVRLGSGCKTKTTGSADLVSSRALATRRRCREVANRTSAWAFWLGCRTMVPKVCRLSGLWIEAGGVCPDFKLTAQVLVRLSPGLTKHRAGLVGRSASVVPAASHTDLRGAGSGPYARDGRGTRSARARRDASSLPRDQTCRAERMARYEMGAHCVGGRQGLVCRCRDVGQESGCRRMCG